MKTAVIIVLALLVVLLGGGFLVSTGLLVWQMKKTAALENDPEKVLVVVAAFDLAEGTVIIDPNTMLRVKHFPRDLVPANYISNPNDVVGLVLPRDVWSGEPITTKMLQRPGVPR